MPPARRSASPNSALFTTNEVVVSNQDLAGAVSGGGYKFTPAPPQPAKSYTVAVDSQIESMGFLQTGYSGSLAPMTVRYPDGTPVDCADSANVLCLSQNNGLLQYVQVNINGRTGDYTAQVNVGATGEATFSFNALAASPIQPAALGKRTLSLNSQTLRVDFGRPSDDGVLAGWLQTAAGARFGSDFSLYDDGAHGDDLPGDGIFGSDAFAPPGSGVAYLWLRGTLDGETITRSDPAPFNFQPIDVSPETPYVQGFLGSPVAVGFAVTNQTNTQRCYDWEISVPTGWIFERLLRRALLRGRWPDRASLRQLQPPAGRAGRRRGERVERHLLGDLRRQHRRRRQRDGRALPPAHRRGLRQSLGRHLSAAKQQRCGRSVSQFARRSGADLGLDRQLGLRTQHDAGHGRFAHRWSFREWPPAAFVSPLATVQGKHRSPLCWRATPRRRLYCKFVTRRRLRSIWWPRPMT